jgi:site-specific DNA-methyltransferase (adenine-specific)
MARRERKVVIMESKLTTKEAAKYLGISVSTLYRMEQHGLLQSIRTPGGQRRFPREELDHYLRLSQSITAPQNPSKFKVSEIREPIAQYETVSSELEVDQIITGDCIEVMKRIPPESVHFAITSPPYNVGINYNAYYDKLEYEVYRNWLKDVWKELKRILVSGGRFALNVAPTSIKNFRPIHYDLAKDLIDLGFIMRTEILWYKQTIYRRTAWGSWKNPANPHIMPSWEYVLVFSKDRWGLEGNSEDADITSEEFIEFSDGFWFIQPETQRNGHPAPFPEELVYRLIKFYSYKGNVVLDMFGGTGTVAYVAAKTRRHFIHIDMSEEYNEVARNRIEKAYEEKSQLILFDKEKITKNREELRARRKVFISQ